jgi:hypothetical protein
MDAVPSAADVQALLAPLDARDRKVLGGLVLHMMREPQRVRDREWLAQRFVELATVAEHAGAAEAAATSDDVAEIAGYARVRMTSVLNAAFALFVRTATDLQERGGAPTLADAHALLRAYLI